MDPPVWYWLFYTPRFLDHCLDTLEDPELRCLAKRTGGCAGLRVLCIDFQLHKSEDGFVDYATWFEDAPYVVLIHDQTTCCRQNQGTFLCMIHNLWDRDSSSDLSDLCFM